MADHHLAVPGTSKQQGIRPDRPHTRVRCVDEILQLLCNGGVSDVEDCDSEEEEINELQIPVDDVVDEDSENEECDITADQIMPTINHNSSSDDDEYALSDLIPLACHINNDDSSKKQKKKYPFKWTKLSFGPPDMTWKSDEGQIECDEVREPIDYFNDYYDYNFFEMAAEKTNMYCLQTSGQELGATGEEIRKFVGIHLMMGCLKYPCVCMYWQYPTRFAAIADAMPVNRFFKLRSNFHVVNNLQDESPENRLWKVQPVIDRFLKKCRTLPLEERLSIDEQMIPFKGQVEFKQYVKNKPNPWGIKLFMLCGESGIAYDLLAYQGSTTQIDADMLTGYGLGASVILTLAGRIPEHQNFKVFADNYFSTLKVLTAMKEKGIGYAGTVRRNRLANCPLSDKREFKKHERGYCEELRSASNCMVVVSWLDNNAVTMVSNFVGKGTEDLVKRWDAKQKSFIEVARPEVIQKYNASMGGVDKMDFLLAIYRIFIRSRKWTLRVLFHFFDLAVCNGWLKYQAETKFLNFSRKNKLQLLHFKVQVAEALLQAGVVECRKRGRPSLTPEPVRSTTASQMPIPAVRYDGVWHLPDVVRGSQQRCKNEACDKKTLVYCTKCNVALCLMGKRNCFARFHRK